MNRPSLNWTSFLALIWFLLSSAFAVPSSVDQPRTTAAPELRGRDVQSICGFWTDVVTTYETWSYWCNGLGCAIEEDVTPKIVFCSTEAFIPYTTYYSYGQWPVGGCGYREACCPSDNPQVRTHSYDNGASLFMACAGADANITDGSQNVYTQLGDFSILLDAYTTTSTTSTVTKTTAAPAGASAVVGSTLTLLTTTRLGSSVSPTTTGHTPSSTSTVVPQSDTPGFKIGLGVGLGLGIPLVLAVGVFAGIWTMRKSRSKEAPLSEPMYVSTQAPHELGLSKLCGEADSKHMVVELHAQQPSELDSRYNPYELDSTK